jgi:DNA-binding response OmpR family regulator
MRCSDAQQVRRVVGVRRVPVIDPAIEPSFGKRSDMVSDKLPRVLVADGDLDARLTLVSYLEDHGARVLPVSGRQEILNSIGCHAPSLVILDPWTGPDKGLNILRDIKENFDVPVIIITAHRCEEIDRATALELGADDYVCKPLALRELLARIRAVLRRRPLRAGVRRSAPQRDRYRFGVWQLDRRTKRVTGPNGSPIALTKSEYNLLVAFLDAPQRPLTREHLLQATRIHGDIFDRSIDVQVLRLRRKLETHSDTPRIITTKRGVGYVFALSVERQESERR